MFAAHLPGGNREDQKIALRVKWKAVRELTDRQVASQVLYPWEAVEVDAAHAGGRDQNRRNAGLGASFHRLFRCASIHISDDAGRVADGNGIWWHRARNHRACADHGTRSYLEPR